MITPEGIINEASKRRAKGLADYRSEHGECLSEAQIRSFLDEKISP